MSDSATVALDLGATVAFADASYNGFYYDVDDFAFADMVYLLKPDTEFLPMPNPYAPGTPLASDVAQTLRHFRPPRRMSRDDIRDCLQDHVQASRRALRAA